MSTTIIFKQAILIATISTCLSSAFAESPVWNKEVVSASSEVRKINNEQSSTNTKLAVAGVGSLAAAGFGLVVAEKTAPLQMINGGVGRRAQTAVKGSRFVMKAGGWGFAAIGGYGIFKNLKYTVAKNDSAAEDENVNRAVTVLLATMYSEKASATMREDLKEAIAEASSRVIKDAAADEDALYSIVKVCGKLHEASQEKAKQFGSSGQIAAHPWISEFLSEYSDKIQFQYTCAKLLKPALTQ